MFDAAELLIKDHRKVGKRFDEFSSGDASVVPEVCAELTVQTTIEERVPYAVLPEITGGDRLRKEAERQHEEVKEAVAHIEPRSVGSAEIGSLMRQVIKGVTHHVREEETELLPKMREELGPDRMASPGDKLAEAKRRELSRRGVLVGLTKNELYVLYELAQARASTAAPT